MKFKKLKINRLPGLKNGLKGYEQLAGNINIVAGPNGSGKSSTARLIQEMLWWKPIRSVEASAELDVEGEHHRIEINTSGYTHYDNRNLPSVDDFSYITPREFSNQYMLALHDLVNDSNEDLAKSIVRELNGGLDLRSAARKLNYSDNRTTTKKGEYTAWREATIGLEKVRNRQLELKNEEKRLDELRKKREIAREANHRKEFYKRLADYLSAQDELKTATLQLELYPEAISRYRENDLETVLKAKANRARLKEKKEKLAREVNELNEQIAGLLIAKSEAGEEKLQELRENLASLDKNLMEIRSIDEDIRGAETTEHDTKKRLEPYLRNQNTENLNMTDIHLSDNLTRKANATIDRNTILKEKNKQITGELKQLEGDKTSHSSAVLSEGISLLSKWLKEKREDEALPRQKKHSYLSLVYSIIVGIATAFCTLLWGIWGLTGLLFFAGLLFFRQKESTSRESRTDIRRKDYESLGLETPLTWESTAVTERLDSLIKQLNTAIGINELQKLLAKNEEELNASNTEIQKIKDEFRQLTDKFDSDALFSDTGSGAYAAFYYFLNHLLEWQKASTELRKKQNQREAKQQESEHLLTHSNKLLQEFNFRCAADIAELKINIAGIEKEFEQRKENKLRLKHNFETIGSAEQELAAIIGEQESVYNRLGIEQDKDNEVETLAGLWNEYRSLTRKIDNISALSAKYALELQDHPLYNKEETGEITTGDALLMAEKAGTQAAGFGELVEEIARIEEKIQSVETHNELEEALGRHDNALENLDTVFEENLQSITGNLIINQLRKEVALNNDNPVFREANRILGNITRHRYSLSIEDSDSPVFRAIDNIQGITLGLNELSTGTRVQLLLAVRLAYIQSQEAKHKVKLPLLADELLANSDDERSEVIIDSLIEISLTRQVFYFTAQSDEVAHWKARLEARKDISSEIILLGENTPPAAPLQIEPLKLHQSVPPPGLLSHREYKELLNVPGFDPIEQNLSEIHLWYIIEDTQALYQLIERGIATWGQLQQFLLRGGKWNDKSELEQKAGLLETFIELYRIGRPRTIDRTILEDSKAISDKFIDEAAKLLEEAAGNPLLLLESLKTLHGFRKSKTDELRAYLINIGYIDDRIPLAEQEISIALQAECSKSGLSPEAANKAIGLLFV